MKYITLIAILSLIFSPVLVLAQAEIPGDTKGIETAIKSAWDATFSYFKNTAILVWDKISGFLTKEVEKRKPEIEAEFEKEVGELKEDLPKTTKTLWERFKDLISNE